MGFFLRKSFGKGPFRLNLSKSGLGASFGVKGARLGVNSRGRSYVHCGREGVYYRKNLGSGPSRSSSKGQRVSSATAPGHMNPGPRQAAQPSVPPREYGVVDRQTIDSGSVSAMTDLTAALLLAEVRECHSRVAWFKPILITLSSIALLTLLFTNWAWVLVALIALIAGGTAALILDNRRKRLELNYELEPEYEQAYTRLLKAFDAVRHCSVVWSVDAEGRIENTKMSGGAGRAVSMTAVQVSRALPPSIRSNVLSPKLPVGRQTLYFLPDTVLIYEGTSIGSVGYAELQSTAQSTQMVEFQAIPTDAKVVGETWRYVNKKGGPDLRFKDNRQVPIIECGVLDLRSDSGLRERVQVSRTAPVYELEAALHAMGTLAKG